MRPTTSVKAQIALSCRYQKRRNGWRHCTRVPPRRESASPKRRKSISTGAGRTGAPGLALQQSIEMLDVIDHVPLGRTGIRDALVPLLEAAHVAPRIDVVRLQLDDVDRDHPDVLEVDRKVADGRFVEILLH